MSEENDTSSATDQSVRDTGITAGERKCHPIDPHCTWPDCGCGQPVVNRKDRSTADWNVPTKESLDYALAHGHTEPDIIEGLAKIQDDLGAYTVAATLRLLSMKLERRKAG